MTLDLFQCILQKGLHIDSTAMSHLHIFGDESGNMDFSRKRGASRFFIVTSVTLPDLSIGNQLLELKRELRWRGYEVGDYFHAATDRQPVRDKVFGVLQQAVFNVDATVLEKSKTQPHIRSDETRFYKMAWYLHLKYVVQSFIPRDVGLFLIIASIGTKTKKKLAYEALEDVTAQIAISRKSATAYWSAASDPCLQIADYCSWAIQRKWERNDHRSYDLIEDKIRSEFDVFRRGTTHYY